MERVKVSAKAGNTSRRQLSIEQWVDSIVPEGDPDYIMSSDGAVMCNEDDLLLGAEAKMMTVDDAALGVIKNTYDKDVSRELLKLSPKSYNLPVKEKESVILDHMTSNINDHVTKDANSHVTREAKDHLPSNIKRHVTNRVKDHFSQKIASDAEVDYMDPNCERELSWRTKLAVMGLIHMDSIQSQPEISNKTYTCIDDILQDRIEDPEEILTNLGFAHQTEMDSPIFKIPVRFLKASTQASGIHVKTILENNPEFKDYLAAKGIIIDEKCETEESSQKNVRSFQKIAKRISTVKKATELMRPSVALFPGLLCIRSPVDNSITWKVQPMQYITSTGTKYHSILHPHNAKYRAEQGLYEQRPLSPEVLTKLSLNHHRKSWFLQKQQAVGGFEGVCVQTTASGSQFPGLHSDSTKILQHNADQKRRMFRDAKGSPLPYPIYKNSPRASPTAPCSDLSPCGNHSENTLQVPEHFQVISERLAQSPSGFEASNCSLSLIVPVIARTNQYPDAESADPSMVSCDAIAVPCDMNEVFCDNSFLRLKADEEAACDNEIEAINSTICDQVNHKHYNKNRFETCYSTSKGGQGFSVNINSNERPAVHCGNSEKIAGYDPDGLCYSEDPGCHHDITHIPEDVRYSQNHLASVDSSRNEVLQSFDLEEIQSYDTTGNEIQQQQNQQQQRQQQQQQREESFRKLIHKDTYTRVSSIQSDSSGFVESIDQPELSSDLHKKIYSGHIDIKSPVPEASSVDSDEAQDFRASLSRSLNMDRKPESDAVCLVQMVEKQPDYGIERFTLQQPQTSNLMTSWRTEPSEPKVEQLVDVKVDTTLTSGSEQYKKAYLKEKDPWKTDSVMDENHKLALSEFGNFLSANSDITLCESDEESSPVNEIVDFLGESNQSDLVKDMTHDSVNNEEAIKKLGDLLANTLHDSGSTEGSSDSDTACGPVINRIVINRELGPSKDTPTADLDTPVTVELIVHSPNDSDATLKVKPSHRLEGDTDSSESECEHGKRTNKRKKGANKHGSDSDDSLSEGKVHGFFRKLTKDKKKTKVLDQLAKSTLTGCQVKNGAENEQKRNNPASIQKDSVVLSQLAEMTASTGLKVTSVNPGANKLIHDDLVHEISQVDLTHGEQEVNFHGQKFSSTDDSASHQADTEADFDVKRPSFLSIDYKMMHHFIENQHPVDTSDDDSDVYDEAPQLLEHLHTNNMELEELSNGSMETALSEQQPSDVTSVNTLHSLNDVNINVNTTSRRSISTSSSISSDNNTAKICLPESCPIEPHVMVDNTQSKPESHLEDRDSYSHSESSHSIWDKTLTSSDIEYLDNLAIELAVPRCVISSRAHEEAKRKTSQQLSNQSMADQATSKLSDEEIVNGRQSDKLESSALSRFMKKLQPKAKSEKRHRTALKKSETIANADDLRKRHDKGSRISKPAILRRRRKNRSKSEPGSIDVEQLEKLSSGSKKKSDSKGFSQWFKNILHMPKSKNAKDVQQSTQLAETSKKKDNAKDQKKQPTASDNIHDAITQLALSTLPMNPEVQNSQVSANYTSVDSEASSKWGVSDSDEDGNPHKTASEEEMSKSLPVQTSVTLVQHHKLEPMSNHLPELDKNDSLRSSGRSTISQLHINLRKPENLEKPHKSEIMLVVVDGKVRDMKKCIASKNDVQQHPESRSIDDVFVDSLSLQSGNSSLQSGSWSSSAGGQRQVASVYVKVKPPESSTVALISETTSRVQPNQQLEYLQQNKGSVSEIPQVFLSDVYICPLDGSQDSDGSCSAKKRAAPVYRSALDDCCQQDKAISDATRVRSEACQHQILCHLMKHPALCDLPDSCQCDELPVWPNTTDQDEKQHRLNEVQLLQKALQKYKLEFHALELKSSTIYMSLADVLSSEDRLACDSLRELQHDISKEISVMEKNLRSYHSSLLTKSSPDKVVLSMNMARLYIIQEMIELMKEQIYRSSIMSRTKQQVNHSISQLENTDHICQQGPLKEQYSSELSPQMVLIQKQLESQQLLMAQTLSRQMEELQSNVLEEIRRSQQQPTKIPHHYSRNLEPNSPGSSRYEGVSQRTVTKNPNTSGLIANSLCPDNERHYVIEVSPETTKSDQQISVSNSINLHDELVNANKCLHGDQSVTHDFSRWQQHDSGFREGEELFV